MHYICLHKYKLVQTAQYGEKEIGALATQCSINKVHSGIFNERNIEKIKNSITNTGDSATMSDGAVTKTLDIIAFLGGIGAYMDIIWFVRNNRLEMLFEGIGRRSFSSHLK